ncbi:MAG TPA: helix-turn-helix transcriptional regulator [Kofleriaceae bacterium]|nr:helix-turn-helix transcriptional regulator [Kofleriaceae bacterium]
MPSAKPSEPLGKNRRSIAAKVRELRQARKWSQAELAERLDLSQSRLSEIERGNGSFTAEQFLHLLKLFNVTASDFVSGVGGRDLRIQNALARLGAFHVQESADVLPSKQLENVHDVVREALVDGSPRVVTGLAPVLVRNAERLSLNKLHAELERIGLERRLTWLVENTLTALRSDPKLGAKSKEWAKLDRRAELLLGQFMEHVTARGQVLAPQLPLDVLDATIRSKRTLEEISRSASATSQRWGIVTSLQPADFLQALRAARAGH